MALIDLDITELQAILLEMENQAGDTRATVAELATTIEMHAAMLGTFADAINALNWRVTELEGEPEPPPPETNVPGNLRGVWLQLWQSNEAAVQRAYAAGANAIFIFTGTGRGVSFANTQGIPRTTNRLQDVIDAARTRGMAVYAAVTSCYFWRDDYPEQNINITMGLTDPVFHDGFLDFRNGAAKHLIAGLCLDLANYDIDGVCLDYTRWNRRWYPGSGLTPGPVTDTVRLCHEALASTGKSLSASPISIWDDPTYGAFTAYGQDWRTWLDRSYVDWCVPMVYPGQWHVDDRLRQWRDWGYWPDKTGMCLSPCVSGRIDEPKTDAAWTLELSTVFGAGIRGITIFDLPIMDAHPGKVAILRGIW